MVICDHISHIGQVKRCITGYLERCNADYTVSLFTRSGDLLINTDSILYSDMIILGDAVLGVPWSGVVTDLRNIRNDVKVVIITNSARIAFAGYRHRLFRCIRRNSMQTDLEECFNEMLFSRRLYDICDTVRDGNRRKRIRVSRIVYYESRNRRIFITSESGSEYLRDPHRTTLDKIETIMLRFRFVRIHQSFLVNMFYIEKLLYDRAHMKGGITLPVSHQRAKASKAAYAEHLRSRL